MEGRRGPGPGARLRDVELTVPWTARRTNVSILGELAIQVPLDDIIFRRILRYFGHIMCRENALENTIVEGKV